LSSGAIPIFEPGLKDLVRTNMAAGDSPSPPARVRPRDTVWCNTSRSGHRQTKTVRPTSGTFSPPQRVSRCTYRYRAVVDESSVPVGTAGRVGAVIRETLVAGGKSIAFSVVSNPEFLKEGSAIDDFMRPDRIIIIIIIGVADDERNHAKPMVMDVRAAELTKYAENAMLAMRISFMNELALLAERVGADIDWVRRGIGSDPSIGTHFLYAGCGYGGSCFPKDVQALIRTGAENGQQLRVLAAVECANEAQKRVLLGRVTDALGADLHGRVIAVWSPVFKPNTDDMRAAPSIVLIKDLLERGASVVAYDPVAAREAARVLGHHDRLRLASRALESAEGADAVVIVIEWKKFRSLDLQRLCHTLRRPLLIDGRNIIDAADARAAGLEYKGIGRP
jgi:UDPglucose 6-dehydrogenase